MPKMLEEFGKFMKFNESKFLYFIERKYFRRVRMKIVLTEKYLDAFPHRLKNRKSKLLNKILKI